MDWFRCKSKVPSWQAMLDNDEHDSKIIVGFGDPGVNSPTNGFRRSS